MSLGSESTKQVSQQDADADQAVGHVDGEAAGKRRNMMAELRGQEQRNEFVEQDEEQEGEHEAERQHVGADLARLFTVPRIFSGYSSGPSAALNENLVAFAPSAMVWPMRPRPAEDGILEDRILVGDLRHRVLVSDDLALRIAHGDAVTVRRQHHHAFHHGLAADEGFLTAFQNGQHLQMGCQAQEASQGHKGHRLHYSGWLAGGGRPGGVL